ncbi:MAG TPA: hypothetical protein VM820_14190 [Vicinamibacterales bacterium]|nr:hypothetical protein [Vicinamibacterales bacterium]
MRPQPAASILLVALTLVCVVPASAKTRAASDAADGAPAPVASGAVTREEMEVVAAELARLRAEVASLRGEIAALLTPSAASPHRVNAAGGAMVATAFNSVQPQQAAPSVDMLRTQVDELSQTKVESSSRMPVRIFGAIVANTVGNSGMANWLDNPNLTDAEVPGTDAGSFTSTLRQSQIGLNVGPIPMGSWTASAAMVADFFGGAPGFVTGTVFGLPRMVYAFGRLEHAGTAILVGQDHNLLAPRDPTSLAAQAFPLLFRSGNLYLRSPQVRVEQKVGGLTLKGGLAAPIAADFNNFYTFAPPAGAGERSERPAFEARADYTLGTPDAAGELTVAFSARQAWREPALALNSATSWAVDFNARLGRIGFAGEYFDTDDAAEFGSAVGQARPAQGGWVEGRLRITSKLSTNVGAGMDEVQDAVPAGARSENRSVFGNIIFDLTPEVAVSLEYRWLETTLGQALAKRNNNHVNAVFVVRF